MAGFDDMLKGSVFGNGQAMQLAGLAVMQGEDVGAAINKGLAQTAQMEQQRRADQEYARQERIRQIMPGLMKHVDPNDLKGSFIKVAQELGDPVAAGQMMTPLMKMKELEMQNQMTPYQTASLALQREGLDLRRTRGSDRDAPSGYQYMPDGTLAPIPGGPADQKAQKDAEGRALPVTAINNISEKVAQRDSFNELNNNFQDGFGGYKVEKVGDVVNTVKKTFGDASGQAQWWQQYAEQKNVIRNKLFGSALTAPEKAEFDKATINIGMDPGEIRKNLARQTAAMNKAVSKLGNTYKKGKYNIAQIDELIGGDPAEDQIVPSEAPLPAPVAINGYPKMVTDAKGRTATVNSEAEAAEAAQEGFK